MNILFIGPYRQTDEWGHKSRSLLGTLQKHGHRVCSRPIYLSSNVHYDAYNEPCELTGLDEYDVLIQFALQPYAVYDGNFKKTIGIFNNETVPQSLLKPQLQKEMMMDEIWVDSTATYKGLNKNLQSLDSSVRVKYVPPSVDISKLPPVSSITLADEGLREKFVFYYMGNPADVNGGFREAYSAYMHSFSESDPVALVVAPDTPLKEADFNEMLQRCANDLYMVGGSRLENLNKRPVMRLVDSISDAENRISLHKSGDCLLCTSYSLAASHAALEAAVYESMPIINSHNGAYEVLGEDNAWGVECHEEYCLTPSRPDAFHRFTSNETWFKPTVMSIAKKMREAYTNKFKREEKRSHNQKLRASFAEKGKDPLEDEGVSK